MKEGVKMEKICFKKWYESLPLPERQKFRDSFLASTDLSYPGFYSKLKRGRFSKLEQKFIIEYAGVPMTFPENTICDVRQ